jgi:hypothetical protein
MVFGQDGKLYYTIGDQGKNQLALFCLNNQAQKLPTAEQVGAKDWSAYEGKVLRMNPDGSIPDDNPEINGVKSHIYTYGHRNAQEIAAGPIGISMLLSMVIIPMMKSIVSNLVETMAGPMSQVTTTIRHINITTGLPQRTARI